MEKDPRTYEHVDPALVGNRRHIVVSDQSGRANILARFRDIGLVVEADDPKIAALVETVKTREYDGYAYDGAEASFELLARRALGKVPEYFSSRASASWTIGAGMRAASSSRNPRRPSRSRWARSG